MLYSPSLHGDTRREGNMAPQANDTPYYLVPNLTALDPSAREIELGAHSWIQATVIDDEDLTFGGKALSTWYEEERQRLSRYSDEEQQRGRQRVSSLKFETDGSCHDLDG
jgi:hypothetical protein